MYAASHLIHAENLERFGDKIAQLNRRIAKIGLDSKPLTLIAAPGAQDRFIGRNRYIWITITGETPTFNGWELISRFDFERAADGSVVTFTNSVPGRETPAELRDIGAPICQHCNTRRFRKNCFLVRNTETNQHLIVGRDCIKDFLGHASPAQLVSLFSFARDIEAAVAEEGSWGGRWGYEVHYSFEEVLSWATSVIRQVGFVSAATARDSDKQSTGSLVNYLLSEPVGMNEYVKQLWRQERARFEPTAEHIATVPAILAFVPSVTGEYGDNLNKIVRLGHCPANRVALLASAAWGYIRSTLEAKEVVAKANEHVGDVGARLAGLTLTVKNAATWESDWGTQHMFVMEDEAGHCFKWTTGSDALEVGKTYTVKATVKKHDEYKGRKQTVLTRAVAQEA